MFLHAVECNTLLAWSSTLCRLRLVTVDGGLARQALKLVQVGSYNRAVDLLHARINFLALKVLFPLMENVFSMEKILVISVVVSFLPGETLLHLSDVYRIAIHVKWTQLRLSKLGER